MYDTAFSFIIHIVQAPRAESRKLAYCVEEGLFFLSSRCADMCWSRRRPEGPWTPHGARLWHRWYLIDVQEKGAQTKHNYIFNDYVFFTPLLEDGAWLQNRKSFTFKHISVTFNTLGKRKPWQENQVWSWAEPETMKVGRELSDMRFHTPQHRSSHALVSLLLNFMICIEFIHVLKCVRDQNMNNADPAGDLKRRHVTTIQRAWRCCNWNHWVNVCSPRTENTRPYGLSGYYNSRSWTSHQKILWLKQRADCLAIERHYANKSFNTSPAIVPVQRCFFNHPLPDKGRDGRRQRKINSRKTGRA